MEFLPSQKHEKNKMLQMPDTFGMLMVYYLVAILCVTLYVVPSFVAFFREHSKKQVILVANIMVGWTLIGWIACMVWSFSE
jgi:hypothetical protein